ncbi:hypothetical protein [Salinibacter ruber]|uniref:hypothetical protein n=1 Tax=Salinibacter ruber TaxID=146919 RepID=UPI00216869CC|nr:hypothetical protein [Salinibacter ruber]MCS4116639.1 hypothetical protein [Salinibacter ruber]MCS4152942.1 hypothetical protein [Salinibacter ruber]
MQPAPSRRARFLHIIVGGWLLALGGLGCTSPPEHGGTYAAFGALDTIEATDTPRDSALAVLARLDRTAFDSAFARLDAYAVTRDVRTEQLDTTGATTAYRTRTLRYPPGTGPGTIQRADSAGRFQGGGFLARLTPSQSPRARPGNLAGQALADQPAYLAPRTQEAYRYALRRDSLLDGTPTHVVEAKVRSGERGADRSIRYARLTVDRASHELVGLTTTRASRILLFRERSQITLRLRRAPDETWVPHLTRVRAVVDVPLRAPRQFRTVSAYRGYAAR